MGMQWDVRVGNRIITIAVRYVILFPTKIVTDTSTQAPWKREGDMATTKGSSGKSGTGKSKRGFASMDPVKQREIASKGGKAAHEKGTAHEFTPEEAAAAGRKGGLASGRGRTSKSSAS
jgi:general stress protein YciG